MKLGFVITNDKASYVAKENSICLLSVAKEKTLNKQKKRFWEILEIIRAFWDILGHFVFFFGCLGTF